MCDGRLPVPAKRRLKDFGEVVEIHTENIVYPAISGHPDIFCCQVGEVLVSSPTLPEKYITRFNELGINWCYGIKPTASNYPDSAFYNAVLTTDLLIHNLLITDPGIKGLAGDRKQIHVNQGYTRCNLLPLPGGSFITSDKGIFKALILEGLEALYVNPAGIILNGFPNGFIGGVCGVNGNDVFIAGSLSYYNEGQQIKDFLSLHALNCIELYDGPLIDGGSILFINK